MSQYDSLILGQVSLDINVDHTGHAVHEVGGAVVASVLRLRRWGTKPASCRRQTLTRWTLWRCSRGRPMWT